MSWYGKKAMAAKGCVKRHLQAASHSVLMQVLLESQSGIMRKREDN